MAVTLYRSLGYVGIAKQSGKGSSTSPSKFYKLLKSAYMPDQKISDFRNGNSRDIAFSVKESFRYAGSFQTFMFADEATALLAWAMGGDTKTGSGDPYTHTLALADSLPWLSVEVSYNENQIIDRVVDSKIARLLIEFEAAKEVLVTADLLGANVAVQGSAATVSFSDGASEGPMRMADAAFTLVGPGDASTLQGQIAGGSITIDQGADTIFGPGQVNPIGILEQGRLITVKLSAYFSGPNLYNLIHYGGDSGTAPSGVVATSGSMVAKFTSQASPEHSIEITTGYLNWKTGKPMFSPDGKVAKMDVEAVAYKSGSNSPLVVVGKNAISSAYT